MRRPPLAFLLAVQSVFDVANPGALPALETSRQLLGLEAGRRGPYECACSIVEYVHVDDRVTPVIEHAAHEWDDAAICADVKVGSAAPEAIDVDSRGIAHGDAESRPRV